jgi:uncharacterized protein
METIVIPPCQGRAFRVKEGQVFRIVNSQGEQTCDFFAFRADYLAEWLSPNHTYSFIRHLRPRPGDVFASRFYRPMLKFLADTSNGWHDMLYAACGLMGYERWRGEETWHANCEDNLRNAMYRMGYSIDVIPQPVNFFMPVKVAENGDFLPIVNTVTPGSYVELQPVMDLICAISACPADGSKDGWRINPADGPHELLVEID